MSPASAGKEEHGGGGPAERGAALERGGPATAARSRPGSSERGGRAAADSEGAAVDGASAVRRVGVVGAGTMGNGIAQVFAQTGRRVWLLDSDPEALERARATIARNLERQARKGGLKGGLTEGPEEVLARIEGSRAVEDLADVDLVVEAVVEEGGVKAALFEELDRVAPAGCILASNTSAISITWLAAGTRRPDRVAGMHFMNPVPVMPLVEVVAGLDTSPATLEAIRGLCRELGKTPVTVRDSPGFVSNRVLMPMINEAVFCLAEGVAEPAEIDAVLKLGMRHPMGPLELADLIGLDVCLAILEVLHRELGEDKYRPCPLLRRTVAAGRLGRKTGHGFHAYPDADG